MNTIKVASAEVALSRVVVQRHKIYTGSVDEQQRPYEGQKKPVGSYNSVADLLNGHLKSEPKELD